MRKGDPTVDKLSAARRATTRPDPARWLRTSGFTNRLTCMLLDFFCYFLLINQSMGCNEPVTVI